MKKILLLLLAVSLITVAVVGCAGTGVPVAADAGAGAGVPESNEPDTIEDTGNDIDVIVDDGSDIIFDGDFDLPDVIEDLGVAYLTGNVVSVEEVNGVLHVVIENENGGQAVFVISNDTVFPFSDSFEIGDEVTGWHVVGPMSMIYPPSYDIIVLVADKPEGANIKVDRFHKWEDNTEDYMISSDGMFAFKTDENTVVLTQNGDEYIDYNFEVSRRIVVIYGVSTRDIPEMATADKLIVLFEGIMALAR